MRQRTPKETSRTAGTIHEEGEFRQSKVERAVLTSAARPPYADGVADSIDIQARVDRFFGVVDMCREIGISALQTQGLSLEAAEAEWRRRRYQAFLNRDRPPFSRRFPNAGIWSSR